MKREWQLKKWPKAKKEALVAGNPDLPKKLLASSKVYISKSGILNAGRGVYARRDIKKGEIIERCPVVEVPKDDVSNLKDSILVTYFFYFGKNKERLAIALGFGSLYNHSYEPNATYKIKPRENAIDFIALEDIKKDCEITVNYNHGNQKDKRSLRLRLKRSLSANKSPLWFEV